ncbi:MAG TPA: MFS transporter [Steroidobacteraceae bacterium]|jgi:MFS family permease|nr:MFS transporter [Steroidobacteraceae bacterium]
MNSAPPAGESWAAIAPLRERTYRRIWSASILSNFGQLILGVGAAWEMTRLTSSASMVALVQTALMVPLMLVSVPAGAFADMFDRRKIAITGLSFASFCAAILTALALNGLTTPWVLLSFCSLIGAGVALYNPAWSASISEQVTAEHLPAAIALGSISYNVARSFGPAVGGVIVLAAGAKGAFLTNAIAYLPLLVAFVLWRRKHVAPRLPPERFDQAIIAGGRYALHSPPVRAAMIRAASFGFASAASSALVPLVVRNMLHGNASTYGLLLGCTGVGAVIGALLVSKSREALSAEKAYALCAIVAGLVIMVVGASHTLLLTALVMTIGGVVNMLTIALLNVGVQLSIPRWVAGRALAAFQASLTGGIAVGAWFWGDVASHHGLTWAFLASGALTTITPLLAFMSPLRQLRPADLEMIDIGREPQVALAITARSGPIAIEIDYEVDPDESRRFYQVMMKLQRARLRNGAFEWSLARDLADPRLWTERYHLSTWLDYARLRSRFTHADRTLQAAADAFDRTTGERRIRRRLERPFGSVRWVAETPDTKDETLRIYAP